MTSHEMAKSKEAPPKNEIDLLLNGLPILKKLFDVHYKIGEGTFSSVFLATTKNPDDTRKFAIKHIIPTYPLDRIERELKCLQEIGGADNVIGVELCVRNGPSVAFIMPYMRHNKFSDYVGDMNKDELKHYMRALLVALRKVHIFNIIHRDVKPSNFLYDRRSKRYLLVDFGLAQNFIQKDNPDNYCNPLIDPLNTRKKQLDENNHKSPLMSSKTTGADKCCCFGKPKICSVCVIRQSQVASRAGTPGYRPPEVLLKYNYQTPAIDVWASGIIMLCILSATQPFFRCPDDCTALAEIITIFGTTKVQQCARKLGKKLICSEISPGIDLVSLCQKLRNRSINSKNNSSGTYSRKNTSQEQYPSEAYDLLSRLLDVDYKTRITANDALDHPFLKM